MDSPRLATHHEPPARATTASDGIDGVARYLREREWMHVLLAPGLEGVRSEERRRPVGSADESGGAWPRVFTDPAALHEFAKDRREARTSRTWESRTEPWLEGLVGLLREGIAGIVLDAGGGSVLELPRRNVGALVAAMATEWFTDDGALLVVMQHEKVYYYTSHAEKRSAFVFDAPDVAGEHLEHMRQRVPDLRVGPIDRSILLEGLLRAGVARLFVNPGLPDQRAYDRDALEVLQALRQGRDPGRREERLPAMDEAAAARADARAGTRAETAPPRPLRRRQRPAPRPPVPGPARSDDESRARLLEIKTLADAKTAQNWLVTEILAHDLDLWVPLKRGADNRPWPRIEDCRDASGRPVSSACVFSNEEMARTSMRLLGFEGSAVEQVPGIEAFRWIWSSPVEVHDVRVDFPAPDGFLTVSAATIPSMLFPSVLDVRDLARVPRVSWDRLASLPHTHGLKPEVVRAFVEGWQGLSGPPSDGSQPPIDHEGGLYLPVFSHSDRYYEYVRSVGGGVPTPQVAGTEAPFLRWLRLASRFDGVVVDPAGDEPMTLTPTDLFYLYLWAETGRSPEGRQVSAALATLQSGDYPLDMVAAGRIAADWPHYLAARVVDGDQWDLGCAPGTDDLALFTSRGEFDDFLRVHRLTGRAVELEPMRMLPRWNRSLFHLANEHYSGIRIDAGSRFVANGVHLDGKGLDGALTRLDERLRPRVPGFEIAT